MKDTELGLESLDTSDVDRWIGRPIGGRQLKEPVAATDIRRWVQAMQNPNRLNFDDAFAAESGLGRVVAPFSFAVACADGHGATPAIQGVIPGSHMLFGGDEWWFFGPRIHAGDTVRTERLAYDYRVADTKFAGPTMFQRGDTIYTNQRGEVIARQRSTSIRYLVANAQKVASMRGQEQEPQWTDQDLERIDSEKQAYYKTFHQHVHRTLNDATKGEGLPRGVIGPHSVQSFTTEWRAHLFQIWGSTYDDGLPSSTNQSGWLPEMSFDKEMAEVDPSKEDGLDVGPSRGHVNPRYAGLIGMPRAYGYGASMGAWVLDYVSNWAGELSLIRHSDIRYRHPPFSGDVTYLDGEVVELQKASGKTGLVTIRVEMTNQNSTQLAVGSAEVSLPAEK
jgi:acyl dehydratase